MTRCLLVTWLTNEDVYSLSVAFGLEVRVGWEGNAFFKMPFVCPRYNNTLGSV